MYPLLVLVALFVTVLAQSPTSSSCPIPDSVFLSIDTSPITNGCDTSNGTTTTFCDNCVCGIIMVFANSMVTEAQYAGSDWCSQDYSATLGMCIDDFTTLLVQNGILTTNIISTLSNCSTLSNANCTDAFNIWQNWYDNTCTNVPTVPTTETPVPTETSTQFPSETPTSSSCPIPSNALLSVDTSPVTNDCSNYIGGATSTFCSSCICGIVTVSANASVDYMMSTGANFCNENPATIFGMCEDSFVTFLMQNSILTTSMIDTLANCSSFNYTTCTDAIDIWENWYNTNCNGGTQIPIANTTYSPTSHSSAVEATLSLGSFVMLICLLVFDF